MLFVNATKVYQFKARNWEIKDDALCLGNVLNNFAINNMKNTGLKGVVKFFSLDFNPIDANYILDIHNYFMKRTWYKIMFGLIKKIFIGLLTGPVIGWNHTKCVSLSNQNCDIQLILINLHLNEYSQEFQSYTFSVKLDRYVEICNTINELSKKACVPNKTKDLNFSVFNQNTGINGSKISMQHNSCECKCKLDETKCKSN